MRWIVSNVNIRALSFYITIINQLIARVLELHIFCALIGLIRGFVVRIGTIVALKGWYDNAHQG